MEELVEQARALALEVLKDETRFDGTPFITHPDNVARIVEDEIGLPDTCVAAVYLHEATRAHKDVDISGFPQDVRTLVDGLNKISTIKPKDTRLEAENYKKLIIQYSRGTKKLSSERHGSVARSAKCGVSGMMLLMKTRFAGMQSA